MSTEIGIINVHYSPPDDPDQEIQDPRKGARELFGADADDWLRANNTSLGGQAPNDLIGTEREGEVVELLYAIRYGAFS